MFVTARLTRAVSMCRKRFPAKLTKRTAVSTSQNAATAMEPSVLIANPSGSHDSRRPLDTLDSSVLQSQMSYVELSLFKRHSKHLEIDQQKNIYDVIDSIEWNTLVTEAHLEKALHLLNDPVHNAKTLTDLETAVLISATGYRCQMLSAKQRNEYTIRLLQIFKKKGVRLGLAARNALLGVQIDNEVDVGVVETLKQYETDGLIPDAQTYGQLSRIYARKADVQGIVEIISHVKNIGLKVPDQILESMVYALASSGQNEKAKSVIEHVTSNISLADSLRMAYALAKAERFEDEDMLEVLDGIANVSSSREKYLISMHEILFALAFKGNLEGISKLKSVFPPLSDDGTGKQWVSIVQNRILRCLSGEEANISAAAMLLDFVPNKEKRSRMRTVLTKQFSSALHRQQNIAEAVRMCIVFQKCNLLKHPLRIYLRDVAYNNPNHFHDLFEIYKRTDDFAEVQDRPHLQLPIAVLHFNELLKAGTTEEKVEHYSKIAHSLYITGVASCGDKHFANVKDLFTVPLLKGLDILPQLMKRLESDKAVQSFVVDMLITQLLSARQMQQLQSLVHGALKNSSAGEAYPFQEVRNVILNSSVYSKNLIPACCLLRLLFPLSDLSSNHQYGKGMQIIKAAILASDAKKAKVLCEVWSDDKRICLRKADKDDLFQTLDRNGEQQKKSLVALLLQKETLPKERGQRMKLSAGEKTHISGKAGKSYEHTEKAETAGKKRVGAELRQALSTGNLEKAKEIWVTGSEHAPIALGLSLAEKLYFSNMMDQFKSVLLKLRELHEDLSYHVLTAYDSSDASDERMTFLNEVSKLLDLHSDVKQQLMYNTRVSAFHKLIESGDLSKAFDLSKKISAQKNSAFGQLDLMSAAIDKDDTAVISEVLNLIRAYHGKESSLADFCVALLERCKRVQAQRLVQSNSFRLSGSKLNYYIDREIDLNRMEVILDLFELCTAEGNLEQRDLEGAVSKIVDYYGKRKNRALISLLEEKLRTIGVRLSPEVNALLQKSKGQDFGVAFGDKNTPES